MPERIFGSEISSSVSFFVRKNFSGRKMELPVENGPALILVMLAAADVVGTVAEPDG